MAPIIVRWPKCVKKPRRLQIVYFLTNEQDLSKTCVFWENGESNPRLIIAGNQGVKLLGVILYDL